MGIDARFLHSAFLYFEMQGWLRAHSMYVHAYLDTYGLG